MNTLNFTVEVPEGFNVETIRQTINEIIENLFRSLKPNETKSNNKKSYITPLEELSPVVRDLIGILPNNLPADDLNGDSVREQVLTEKFLQNQTTLLQATRNIS